MTALELFDLRGRTALVTGSSRGLGFAIAEGLACAGASVVLNGLDEVRLNQAVETLQGRGHTVEGCAFDVGQAESVALAFERLDAQNRRVDVLVNNAGIQLRKPLLELEVLEWERVLQTNLTSAFLVGRQVARRLIAEGRPGKIINVGSVLCEVARPTIAPYASAKGGLKLLTRSMAAEWAACGIQVNGIGPGYMATEMNTALLENPQFDAWVKSRTPAGRWGRPEELVGTAVYLASAASDFVNGQMIYVDGGLLAVV